MIMEKSEEQDNDILLPGGLEPRKGSHREAENADDDILLPPEVRRKKKEDDNG